MRDYNVIKGDALVYNSFAKAVTGPILIYLYGKGLAHGTKEPFITISELQEVFPYRSYTLIINAVTSLVKRGLVTVSVDMDTLRVGVGRRVNLYAFNFDNPLGVALADAGLKNSLYFDVLPFGEKYGK